MSSESELWVLGLGPKMPFLLFLPVHSQPPVKFRALGVCAEELMKATFPGLSLATEGLCLDEPEMVIAGSSM